MGIFDNLFNRRKNQLARDYYDSNFATFTAYNPVFRDWNGKLYESELVRASVDTIARHISKLKIEYHGSAHPELINRLKKGICPFMTDSQFLYKTATMLYMSNTCFILPVLDNNLQTIGYYADIPEEWKLKKYKGDYWIRMKFADRSVGAVRLDEVGILTRFHYKDMLFGDSHSGLDETMKLLNIQRQAIEENVRNGATYRFWGQYMQVAKESDLEKERKRFTEKNLSSKADNSGMLLFPRDYDNIHQIENKPYSIDTAQMQLIKDNVYDFYGVNTDMIQNKASSEVMDAFFNGLIEPFAIQMGEVLRNLIFSYNERSYGNDVYLVANRLQYMSTSQKIQMARDFGDRGILSVNEIRELLNFAPRDDGDVTFIRGEYFTTDQKLTELAEAQTEDTSNVERSKKVIRFNPYHDKENGQFTSPDNAGTKSDEEEENEEKKSPKESFFNSEEMEEEYPEISLRNIEDEDVVEAIRNWQYRDELINNGKADYKNINDYLQGVAEYNDEEKKILDKQIALMDKGIQQKLEKDAILYTGWEYPANTLSVGQKIENKGFTSTTGVPSIAEEFGEMKKGSVIKLRVNKGAKALLVGASEELDEGEILFGRNNVIKVTKVTEDGYEGEIYYE